MPGMERRTGIYSGTFDPVHPGHITFATEAMRVCNLDEVVFLPEQRPRGKHNVVDISHRLAMIDRATMAIAGLRALSLQSERFTVQDTLPELQDIFGDAPLTLLLGSDVVRTFPYRWDGLDVLLGSVSLAIGMRANDDPNDILAIMQELEQGYDPPIQYSLVHTPDADIASSQIRNGTADTSRLPPAMLDYIQTHGFYT